MVTINIIINPWNNYGNIHVKVSSVCGETQGLPWQFQRPKYPCEYLAFALGPESSSRKSHNLGRFCSECLSCFACNHGWVWGDLSSCYFIVERLASYVKECVTHEYVVVQASESFTGSQPGYVFQMGEQGWWTCIFKCCCVDWDAELLAYARCGHGRG